MAEPSTVTLTLTAQEAQLLFLAAARFAIPMRGNAATRIILDVILANAAALDQQTRSRICEDLRNQAYIAGDPWTDMDSAVYSEAADLLQAV